MFLLQLLYAGAVALVTFVGMVSNTNLNTHQVFDVAIPAFVFVRLLYTELSRPVPQANDQVILSDFLSSVATTPVTITDLIVRPPSLVPSVIVSTTKNLAIIPTTCNALLTLKGVNPEFSPVEDDDVCEWPSVIPITLINICEVLATPPAPPPPTPTRPTARRSRPAAFVPVLRALAAIFVFVYATALPGFFKYMSPAADKGLPTARSDDIRPGPIVLDGHAVADSHQAQSILNGEAPKTDSECFGVIVLDARAVADSTKAQSVMNGEVHRDETPSEDVEGNGRAEASEGDEDGEQVNGTKQRKKRRAKKKKVSALTTEVPWMTNTLPTTSRRWTFSAPATADQLDDNTLASTSDASTDPQASDWIVVGAKRKGKGKAAPTIDITDTSTSSQAEAEPVASTSTQVPDQLVVHTSKKRRRKRGGVRSEAARAKRNAEKMKEKEQAQPEAPDFPILAIANTLEIPKARQRLWKVAHGRRTAFEKNLEKIIAPTVLFDNEIPDLEQFWVLKKCPLRPAVQRPMTSMLPPVIPFTEDDILLTDTMRELHAARRSSRSSYASVLKVDSPAT
ncbi:hypothetical protein EIP91_002556 [Steccherinum ochraceum]|uniref:Uncharacterized protein n=1 Tax=Steccherinum ochraceum TaxID=92696 RepID=A0A4R0RNR6_9APHY|nr:hypothetical protein EIP91_002556 [Steccherinum ochraceum]